jgi:prevent-host-death family protein
MITATFSETRRRLGELIELAGRGEDVVIIRDNRPVAALTPVTPADLELATRITGEQAKRFHRMMDAEPKTVFKSAASAVARLKRSGRVVRKRP